VDTPFPHPFPSASCSPTITPFAARHEDLFPSLLSPERALLLRPKLFFFFFVKSPLWGTIPGFLASRCIFGFLPPVFVSLPVPTLFRLNAGSFFRSFLPLFPVDLWTSLLCTRFGDWRTCGGRLSLFLSRPCSSSPFFASSRCARFLYRGTHYLGCLSKSCCFLSTLAFFVPVVFLFSGAFSLGVVFQGPTRAL